jgi:hypothetical protein
MRSNFITGDGSTPPMKLQSVVGEQAAPRDYVEYVSKLPNDLIQTSSRQNMLMKT